MKRSVFQYISQIGLVVTSMLVATACTKEESFIRAAQQQTAAEDPLGTVPTTASTCLLDNWAGTDVFLLGQHLFGHPTDPVAGAIDSYLDCYVQAPATSGSCCTGVVAYVTSAKNGDGDYLQVRNSWGQRWGESGFANPIDDGTMTAEEMATFANEVLARANELSTTCHGGQLVPAAYELSYEVGPNWIDPVVQVTYVPVCD